MIDMPWQYLEKNEKIRKIIDFTEKPGVYYTTITSFMTD